jgi:hypothetical protein
MRKQIAAAAMAASIITGAGAGALLFGPTGANAATSTTTAAPAATPAPGQWVTDAMKKLVDAGTITQAQSDAVVAALQAARPAGGHGPGPGHHPDLAAAAKALGLTAEQLRSELTVGTSLADVAKAHGVAEQAVIDALVTDAEAHLADAVTAGRLTQAEADAKKADLPAAVKQLVESPRPAGGLRGPRGAEHGDIGPAS